MPYIGTVKVVPLKSTSDGDERSYAAVILHGLISMLEGVLKPMLQEVYVVFVVGVLMLWLIGSVILQFGPTWFSFIERHDLFMLLPRWTFFAPTPGMSDYHLLYRDQLEDGRLSEWVEIPITEERKLYSFLWNPEKKSKKVLSDVVASLLQLSQLGIRESTALMFSLPYLILLNVVVHHDRKRAGIKRRFVLAEKFRDDGNPTVHVVLVSAFHPLEGTRHRQSRKATDQLHDRPPENREWAQQIYAEMKRRDPEFWKACGFANEHDCLMFNGLTDVIDPSTGSASHTER